jgi:hypothetical protein
MDQQQQEAQLYMAFFATELARWVAKSDVGSNGKPTNRDLPTLESSLCDYFNSVVLELDYTKGMTNLRFFSHLSVLKHANEVLARRLGLNEYIKDDKLL